MSADADADALQEIRTRIDSLDRELVRVLAAREQLVREAGRLKPDRAAVRGPARVEQVVARVRAVALELGTSPDVVERTYRAMVAGFIDLELAAHDAHSSGDPGGAGVAGG